MDNSLRIPSWRPPNGGSSHSIEHPDLKILQVPFVYVQSPHNGSTRDLGESLLAALDGILGTTYRAAYSRANEETLIKVAAGLFEQYFVGLLIIDEIQSISHRKSGGREEFMDFFLKLFNTLHLSIVVIGTMKAVSVLQTTFRQARRVSSMGSLIWNRLDRQSKDWKRLVAKLWEFQWLSEPTPFSDEIDAALYDHTQGITALVVRLLILAQHRAIRLGDHPLSADLFKRVAEDNFSLLKPMLDALRSGSPARIARYDDLEIPKLEEFPEFSVHPARSEFAELEGNEGLDATAARIRRQTIDALAMLGVPLEAAAMHVDAILAEQPTADALAVHYEALIRISGKPMKRGKRNSKEGGGKETGSIPVGYDQMEQAGLIGSKESNSDP